MSNIKIMQYMSYMIVDDFVNDKRRYENLQSTEALQ